MIMKDINKSAVATNNSKEKQRQHHAKQIQQTEGMKKAKDRILRAFKAVFRETQEGTTLLEDLFESDTEYDNFARHGEMHILTQIFKYAEEEDKAGIFKSEDGDIVLTVLRRDFRYDYPDLPSPLDVDSEYRLNSRFGRLRVLHLIQRACDGIDFEEVNEKYQQIIKKYGG